MTKSATSYAQGIFRSKDLTCFYSGVKLHTDVPAKDQLRLTVEHLIPTCNSAQGNHHIRHNMVPAAGFINTMIGNAPLAIKFGLKKHLSGLAFHPSLNDAELVKTIKACAKIYLDQFYLHKHHFWSWRAFQGKGNECAKVKTRKQRELYEAYYKLLLPEEIQVGAYTKWEEREGFGPRKILDWRKLMVDTA